MVNRFIRRPALSLAWPAPALEPAFRLMVPLKIDGVTPTPWPPSRLVYLRAFL